MDDSGSDTQVQPRVGSGVLTIDPFHFLAGCRIRRQNQALSVLSLICSTYPFLQFDCIIDCIIDYFCTEPLKPLVLHNAYASLNLSLLHYITLHKVFLHVFCCL